MGCNSRKRGCDGIFVQAPPSDASRLQRFFKFSGTACFFLLVVSEEWERLYCKYVDLHKAVNLKKLGNNHKAKALWLMRDAKTNGERTTVEGVSDN